MTNRSCRVCLCKVEPSERTSIFSVASGGQVIASIIKEIAAVEIAEDDDFPKIVCPECLRKLNSFCEFQAVILSSAEKLRESRPVTSKGHKLTLNLLVIEVPKQEVVEYENEPIYGLGAEVNNVGLAGPDVFIKGESNIELLLPEIETVSVESPERQRVIQLTKLKPNKGQICSECNMRFKNRGLLKIHLANRHPQEPMCHCCEVCGRGYPNRHMANVHRQDHSEEKYYKCLVDGCGKAFWFQTSLWAHKRSHPAIKPPNSHKCTICGKVISSLTGLQEHIRRHRDKKRVICQQCSKTFNSAESLHEHLAVYDSSPVCSICGKSYRHSKILKMHMKTHVNENARSTDCEVCKKRFMGKISLDVHMRIHHNAKRKTSKNARKVNLP